MNILEELRSEEMKTTTETIDNYTFIFKKIPFELAMDITAPNGNLAMMTGRQLKDVVKYGTVSPQFTDNDIELLFTNRKKLAFAVVEAILTFYKGE